MLRRSPIFSAVSPDLVSSGLMRDVHPLLSLLWEDASNVSFNTGKVQRLVPPSQVFVPGTVAGLVKGISQQRQQDGQRFVWAAGKTGVDTYRLVRWGGVTVEQIVAGLSVKEVSGVNTDAGFVDIIHWGDWTLWTNKAGKIGRYRPGVGVDTLADGYDASVRIMKKLNFLLAFGVGTRGTRFAWSAADQIDVWTPTAENEAGSAAIDDFDTAIKSVARLGQHIAVYSEDQMALVSYISSPFYFGQKVVLDGIGACGQFSVGSDGASNFGVGRNGVWWTDSNSYRYIDEGWIKDYLQDNVNWDQAAQIIAARNDVTNCWEFHFPTGLSTVNNEAWAFDPRNKGWSKLPAYAVLDERKVLNKPLAGTVDGNIKLLSDNSALAAPLALVTRPLLMQYRSQMGLEDVHTDTRIDEVEMLVKDCANVQFRVESSQKIEGPYSVTDWINLEAKGYTYRLPQLPSGVYHKLRFQSIADDWDLNLQGFMFFGEVEGTKRD